MTSNQHGLVASAAGEVPMWIPPLEPGDRGGKGDRSISVGRANGIDPQAGWISRGPITMAPGIVLVPQNLWGVFK